MTRRLEGPRPETARLNTTEAQYTEAPRAQAVNRRRLKAIGKTAEGAQGANSSARTDVATGLQAAGAEGRKSLDEILNDFIMPRLPEPAIMRRSVSILQHCVTDIVPTLEGGEQLRELARTLLQEEIARHRDLFEKLHGDREGSGS